MTDTTLKVAQKQTQQLSRALHQSLQVLHMSTQRLEETVTQWLDENPLLERLPEDDLPPLDDVQYIQVPITGAATDETDIWSTVAELHDFRHDLHKQVCEHPLDDDTAALVHLLIDNLDEHGYLKDSLVDLAEHTPLEWKVDEFLLGRALLALQQFDPPGIGARDLSESLRLQLSRLPESDTVRCATELTIDYLGMWKTNSGRKDLYRQLSHYSRQTIDDAIDLIASLNPYPVSGLEDNRAIEYIRPDIIVREGKHGFVAEVVRNQIPRIRINPDMMEIAGEVGELDPLFKGKIQEARVCIDCLKNRESMLQRLGDWVLARQTDFFTFGAIGLTPLTIKETAAALGLADSTISRAVNQKYLFCDKGMYPLRYFFTQSVVRGDSEGTGSSQTAVKTLISTIVAGEDPAEPLSDIAIVEKLRIQGIDLARRTVAKYREEINIPPAHKRRQKVSR